MLCEQAVVIVLLAIAVWAGPQPVVGQINVADVSGAWLIDLDPDFGGNADTITCTFTQDGEDVTGECGHGAPEPQAPFSGHVSGDTLTFAFKTSKSSEQTPTFTATLGDRAATMKAEWRFVDDQGKV